VSKSSRPEVTGDEKRGKLLDGSPSGSAALSRISTTGCCRDIPIMVLEPNRVRARHHTRNHPKKTPCFCPQAARSTLIPTKAAGHYEQQQKSATKRSSWRRSTR